MTTSQRRPSLSPRRPRAVFPGPRIRIFELLLILHVVVAFMSIMLAWLLHRRGENLAAVVPLLLIVLLLLVDLRRLHSLKPLRRLAAGGSITAGRVIATRLRRTPNTPRADGPLPRGGLPFIKGLEVSYEFEDDQGKIWPGTFLASSKDEPLYTIDHPVEVFFLPESPSLNVCSLVLRWYYRLGGPAVADEPPEGFAFQDE